MIIGKLDRLITIQRKADGRDANGGVEVTWSNLIPRWAEKQDQGGREFRSAGALLAETTTYFKIRYYAGLTTQDRIRYDGVSYDILSISEIGRREGMLIQCKTEVGT